MQSHQQMEEIPYYLEDYRRRSLSDPLFNLNMSLPDYMIDSVEQTTQLTRRHCRPWRARYGVIISDNNKFQVHLDVLHFAPKEITVKIVEGSVVIEGKHEEKKDEHGHVSRQFKRRYALPEGCNPEAVECKLSADAVLTVSAPRTTASRERAVPITQVGPIRRKPCDDQRAGNDNAQANTQPPAQKRRKSMYYVTIDQEKDLAQRIIRFANIGVPVTPKVIQRQAFLF